MKVKKEWQHLATKEGEELFVCYDFQRRQFRRENNVLKVIKMQEMWQNF